MSDFFRGWKRKVGVVTLIVACVFTGCWIRSLSVADVIRIRSGRCTLDHIFSSKFGLNWDRYTVADASDLAKCVSYQQYAYWYGKSKAVVSILDQFVQMDSVHHRSMLGFHWGQGSPPLDSQAQSYIHISFVIIPYWSIVIPLTLLSAYLLLSNSRKPKSGPTHV